MLLESRPLLDGGEPAFEVVEAGPLRNQASEAIGHQRHGDIAHRQRVAGHELVGEVRTLGFLGAIEIVKDKATRARFAPAGSAAVIIRDHAVANGLMMRATGDTMIMSPPLIWTRETIDLACDRIVKALDLAAADLRGK